MAYSTLLDGFEPDNTEKKKKPEKGCTGCPLNDGRTKIIGLHRIKGKRVFIHGQSPNKIEEQYVYINEAGEKRKGLEFVGPPGDFLWKALDEVGIKREDCDTGLVLRCRPTEYDKEREYYKDRKATKDELYHCSIYIDKAIEKAGNKAVVHICLGLVAAQALLGKEFKNGRTVFWSNRLNAKVVCIPHPAYFLRDGFAKSKLNEFKQGLRTVAEILGGKTSRFDFIEALDIKPITTPVVYAEFAARIKEAAAKGMRCAIDLEDGKVNDQRVGLNIAFCFDHNYARVAYIDKSDAGVKPEDRGQMLEITDSILSDETIKKSAHHAVYDGPTIKMLWGIKLRGLDFDTELAEYLAYSDRKKYGLENIAETRFQKFAGYKDLIDPYVPEDGPRNYDRIPFPIMTMYNGTDAIMSKMIEKTTAKKINYTLLQVYIDAAYEVAEMQNRGPCLDYQYYKEAEKILPVKLEKLKDRMCLLLQDPDFSPTSQPQVKRALYTKLQLPLITDRKGKVLTGEEALVQLIPLHEFPKLLQAHRKLAKVIGTYMLGSWRSAEANGGELRSKWYITGASTGRLRSSGGKDPTKIAMQNLHGDEAVQNLLVSDPNWRLVLGALK